MPPMSPSSAPSSGLQTVRVLGTGGTIAGTAPAGAPDNTYQAAQLAVEDLLRPLLPGLAGRIDRVQAVQVAQLDSRSMSHAVWQRLAAELQAGLDDPAVVGQVVTHGTDTLEETAVFLQGVLRGTRPVVLTAAMRPATSPQADGPGNLTQALHLAADSAAQGVLMAFAGQAWPAVEVRKVHPFSMQAFGAGDGQPVARWLDQAWVWTSGAADGLVSRAGHGPYRWAEPVQMPENLDDWPRVEIVHSHAGADGQWVDRLLAEDHAAAAGPAEGSASPHAKGRQVPVSGLVISATGNGSIHDQLHRALTEAVDGGRLTRQQILVATRCTQGWIVGSPEHGWPVARDLTPAQARVALMLELARRGSQDTGLAHAR